LPQTAAELDLGAPQLVTWQGAERWVHAGPGQGARLRDAAAAVGGHATLFRAQGAAAQRFHPLPPALQRIHRDLKREFDPAGIFNPGRLFPDI
jgi:glycolate oxidase FAD binding subunit